MKEIRLRFVMNAANSLNERDEAQGEEISLELLSESTSLIPDESGSIEVCGKRWIEKSMRKESTKKNMLSTIKWLKRFDSGLTFSRLDSDTLYAFELFLKHEGLSTNSTAKHIRQLRTLVNEAVNRKLVKFDINPFHIYKVKTVECRHSFLSPNELARLEKLRTVDDVSEKAGQVLDAFLFCCYTGLRFSDFIRLTADNFSELQGHLWLDIVSQKTNVRSRIPLDMVFGGKAIAIMRKYEGREGDLFRMPHNSTVNRYLKKLAAKANIQKRISFHTSRHTNATSLLFSGAKLTTVQKLMGHRSVKTTQCYAEIMSETILRDLSACKF